MDSESLSLNGDSLDRRINVIKEMERRLVSPSKSPRAIYAPRRKEGSSKSRLERAERLSWSIRTWRRIAIGACVILLIFVAFVIEDFTNVNAIGQDRSGTINSSGDTMKLNYYMDSAMTMRANWEAYTTSLRNNKVPINCNEDLAAASRYIQNLNAVAPTNIDHLRMAVVDYFEQIRSVARQCREDKAKWSSAELAGKYAATASVWQAVTEQAIAAGWRSECSKLAMAGVVAECADVGHE